MHSSTFHPSVLSLALGLGVVLPACASAGGDDDATSSTGAGSEATTAPATETSADSTSTSPGTSEATTSTTDDPTGDASSSSSGEPACDEDPFQGLGTEIDIAVCDPAGTFTLEIDNAFFPLVVGETKIFEGMDEDELIHLEITVLDETEEVAGVVTRVVEEHEMIDGETVEISRNYFAQTMDGTVCYFGEAVDIYEGGEIVAHDGAWRADDPNAAPGIQMPADPMAGTFHAQETVPGVAEDYANIIALDDEIMVPFGTFDDTVVTSEWSPLEPCHFSDKAYAAGLGLLYDGEIPLIDVVSG